MKLNENPMEFINRRRRQLHVHSVIYYHMGLNLVPDATWDKWAVELVKAQKAHPVSAFNGYLPGVFANWTGDTGMHLPMREDTIALAERLVAYANKIGWTPGATVKADGWEGDVGYAVK